MLRHVLLVLLWFLPVSRAFADWPLGSQELGPAPGWRHPPSVVASRHRTLAVWPDARVSSEERLQLLAAWLDAEGRPLETFRISKRSGVGAGALATDGESHLLLWHDRALQSTLFDREGTATTRDLGLQYFYPAGLAWNGSFYLATSSQGDMVLLDRQGSIVSGLLTQSFASYPFHYVEAASSGTRWLVAGAFPERRGMVEAADFPPIGESRAFVLPPAPSTAGDRLAAFSGGSVSVNNPYGGSTEDLVVRFHDSSGDPWETHRFIRPGRVFGPVRIAVRERSLYIAYQTCPAPCTSNVTEVVEVRFGPGLPARKRDQERDEDAVRSSEITLLGTMSGRQLSSLVSTPAGVLAFADDGRWENRQLYSALVGSEAFRSGGTLFTVDRERQRSPRIASAEGAHLVAWVGEGRNEPFLRILFTILGDDGKPVGNAGSVPVELSRDWRGNPIVASDGRNFLLAWQSYRSPFWEMNGVILSRDGEIVRPPFVMARNAFSQSIVWNGAAYVVAVYRDEVVLVGSDGTILEPNPARIDRFPPSRGGTPSVTYLARDGEDLLVLGVESHCPPFDAAYCALSYEAAVRRADLTSKGLESETDQAWNGRRLCCGLSKDPESEPALAAGGGHRLVAWYEFANTGRFAGHVAGDEASFDFDSGDDPPPLHAVWTGSGFLVAAGPALLHHAPRGSLLERRSLGDDVLESAVAMGRVPFVVMVRDTGVPRLFVRPLDR